LSIYRSNTGMYAQIIDDETGRTLVSTSSLKDKKAAGVPKIDQAKIVGAAIAEKAKAAGHREGRFRPQRIPLPWPCESLAEAAREAGLNF
jgi:large subunit ribosomal protein L18